MKKRLKVFASIAVLILIVYLLFGSFIQHRIPFDRYRTETLLAEIESAMSRHQIDLGFYPRWSGSPKDGAAFLYQELCKRGYLRENFPAALSEGKKKLVDAWGNPFRYRLDLPTTRPDKRKAKNPTYDLWSTGGSTNDSDADQSKWITNWFVK